MGFLDNNGLERLWERIKSKISEQVIEQLINMETGNSPRVFEVNDENKDAVLVHKENFEDSDFVALELSKPYDIIAFNTSDNPSIKLVELTMSGAENGHRVTLMGVTESTMPTEAPTEDGSSSIADVKGSFNNCTLIATNDETSIQRGRFSLYIYQYMNGSSNGWNGNHLAFYEFMYWRGVWFSKTF